MRHNQAIMLNGVTMYSPETILIAPESLIGQDTIIQAGVQISGQSTIGAGCLVETGVTLHNCQIGHNVVVGAKAVLHNCRVEDNTRIPPLTCQLEA
ncbi:MAG: hypothetical protein D3923_15450 [Candidatus Electrothrix sp. AR3]|nr:hypothetical protein [Candidatus Electrothrix sp. AR3]